MGVRNWGIGLVAAVVIAATTASSAPVVQAAEVPAVVTEWSPSYDLPAALADKNVAATGKASKPEKLEWRWACNQPINIYYAASTSEDSDSLVRQLEYPVRYLQNLGYKVRIMREVAYQADYKAPTTPGDVLVIAPRSNADLSHMHAIGARAYVDTPGANGVITSAIITADATRGLASDVIFHEFGHVLGLPHKPDTVMAEAETDSVALDTAETAAIDCR